VEGDVGPPERGKVGEERNVEPMGLVEPRSGVWSPVEGET
jgi:hypothetical protein